MFLLAYTQTRLSHKVTKRKRFRQALCLASKNHSNLIQQEPRGGIVAGQMMLEFQYHPALPGLITGDVQTPHRRLTYIHPIVPGIETRAQLFGDITVCGIKGHFFHGQRRMPPYHLDRLGQAFPDNGSAQNVMAVNDSLQCSYITIKALTVCSAQERRR
jgi:hypothetical protein